MRKSRPEQDPEEPEMNSTVANRKLVSESKPRGLSNNFKYLNQNVPRAKPSRESSSASSRKPAPKPKPLVKAKGFSGSESSEGPAIFEKPPALGKRRRNASPAESERLQKSRLVEKAKEELGSAAKKQGLEAVRLSQETNDPNKFKPSLEIAPMIAPKERGSFLYGDQAKRIVNTNFLGEEILCELEWRQRKGGERPLNSWHSNTFIKEFDPLLLVNFYETRIRQKGANKGKRQMSMFLRGFGEGMN